MNEELKPCPNCGEEAKLRKGWCELENYVECTHCGLRTKPENTKNGAIKIWNRRVVDER